MLNIGVKKIFKRNTAPNVKLILPGMQPDVIAHDAFISIGLGCQNPDNYIDGVVAEQSLTIVQKENIAPFMTGLIWRLRWLGDGTWALLNQGLENAALTNRAPDVALGRIFSNWSTKDTSWFIYYDEESSGYLLRSKLGGWLTMDVSEAGLRLNKFNAENIASQFITIQHTVDGVGSSLSPAH